MPKRTRTSTGPKAKSTAPPRRPEPPDSPESSWRRLRPVAKAAVILMAMAIWVGGVALRGGFSHSAEVVYDTDPAFHDRMVLHLLDAGEYLPADLLFVQEPLRQPARDMYPALLHYTAAGWALLARWTTGAPPSDSLLVFGALAGSLLVPLTGWAAWRASGRAIATLAAMLLAAVSTAAVLRGYYTILRPEPLGAALAVSAVLLFWSWDGDARPLSRWTCLAAIAGVHFLGTGTWRPFPLLATVGGAAVVAAAFGQARRCRMGPPFGAAVIGTAAAGLAFEFYRAGGIGHAVFLLPVPFLILLCRLQDSGPLLAWAGRWSPRRRWALLAAATATAVVTAHGIAPSLRIRVNTWLNPGFTELSPANLYGRIVAELQPFSFTDAFAPFRYWYLPVVLGLLALAWIFRPAARPRGALLPLAAAGFGLLGLLMVRFEYVALPFVFALLCIGLDRALESVALASWRRTVPLAGLLVVLLPIVLIQANLDRSNIAPPARRELNRRECFDWMRRSLPRGTVVAANWSLGYELQRYAGCATATDGYLESPINRQRLLAFYAALFSEDEGRMATFCRNVGARYLLLDRYNFLPIAETLQLPLDLWVKVSEGGDENLRIDVLPDGRRLVYLQLLSGYPTRYFRPIHISGNYLVLEFLEPAGG